MYHTKLLPYILKLCLKGNDHERTCLPILLGSAYAKAKLLNWSDRRPVNVAYDTRKAAKEHIFSPKINPYIYN